MTEAEITEYICTALDGVDSVSSSGDTFFFYQPAGQEPDRRFPFATLVTGDSYDTASNLERPGVFRLNLGVSRETYRSLFGTDAPREPDFTALDSIMPHPVYAAQHWVCVLNPSTQTWDRLKPLLAEAHALAVRRMEHRATRAVVGS